MGAVFEAVREEGGARQSVAIKVLTGSVPDGAAGRQLERERRALCELDHPGIVRPLDWGQTASGHAYLAMDYVRDGRPIDQYCASLDTPAILRVFLEVCDAVAHAHRNLIVHSDLKPSNVLVTPEGRAKLLDFGIARLLGNSETARSRTSVRYLTPSYASPEQILGKSVGTASDIYSLGVLLHELLTGSLPYRNSGSEVYELSHAILNEEPGKASETAGVDASRRKALRGDLDRILQKALEKEPARRYSSVESLAEDLRNHLNGRPVKARGTARWYRAARFVRRHWLSVALLAVAALSLACGIAAATWKARVAEKRLREMQEVSHALIFDLHDSIATLPGATRARQRLISTSLRYLDRLSAEEAGDDSLLLDLAAAYEKIGEVQGNAFEANLGDSTEARRSFDKALELLRRYRSRHPFDPTAGDLLLGSFTAASELIPDPARAAQFLDEGVRVADTWVAARSRKRRRRPAPPRSISPGETPACGWGTCPARSGTRIARRPFLRRHCARILLAPFATTRGLSLLPCAPWRLPPWEPPAKLWPPTIPRAATPWPELGGTRTTFGSIGSRWSPKDAPWDYTGGSEGSGTPTPPSGSRCRSPRVSTPPIRATCWPPWILPWRTLPTGECSPPWAITPRPFASSAALPASTRNCPPSSFT
jgi:hypothetical protein